MAGVVDELDVERVVRFLWAVIDRSAVAVSADTEIQRLFAATLDLLPPSGRLEYSFSTALKYSVQRPCRCVRAALIRPPSGNWYAAQE